MIYLVEKDYYKIVPRCLLNVCYRKSNNLPLLLLLIASIFGNIASTQIITEQIALNQVGFYPFAPKVAVVTGPVSATTFFITSTNLRDTFFTGNLSAEKSSAYSSTKTRIADFSSFNSIGSYVVLVPGLGNSYVFAISGDVFKETAVASLKGFYFQRSAMPLHEKFAGKWHRSAGHLDDVVSIHPSAATKERPEGTIISTPGGWYDAGDYNKYIVNSGITMGTLLAAYEDFSGYYKTLRTNIPESGDAVPDILNEIIYNLRWMLTMQDPSDGGVYNKCTNAEFDGMIMPGITKAPRYVVQKGAAATLDFAAVTAQANRILYKYKKAFPGLADSCLQASKKAWAWAEKNPALVYDQNYNNEHYKPQILTGGYGDRNFKDEWLWAAAELYLTTKEDQFYEVVKQRVKDTLSLPGWNNVAMLGYYSFIRLGKTLPPTVQVTTAFMKERILAIADTYLSKVSANAFGTVMGQSVKDFSWGGNSIAANQGILLIYAYSISSNKKFIDGALSNLDYLLGRNATGYSFVTSIGSKSPMHPHHRPSVADGVTDPVPGLLVGGPNPGMQDKCSYPFSEPETAYTDDACSYASNEVAINWNAPIMYLANALEALKVKIGYTRK